MVKFKYPSHDFEKSWSQKGETTFQGQKKRKSNKNHERGDGKAKKHQESEK